MTENTAITPLDNTDVEAVKDDRRMISTFSGGDRASKIDVMKALTTSTPLEDVLNREINLANFVIEPVDIADTETGEINQTQRATLVTDQGTAYHAISSGVINALERLTVIMGWPAESDDWPIIVKPTQEKTRKGYRVFTLEIVG